MKQWRSALCLAFVGLLAFWCAVASAEEIVVGFTGPLSGPGAEFGQDCVNGIDMAVKELNAAGGVTVRGKKYTFRLERLDDRIDPTQAKNNTMRFVSQHKALAVFNPITPTLAVMMGIPQNPGSEFIIAAYTSFHAIMDKGHPMLITAVPDFSVYANLMTTQAREKGYKNLAMVVTTGGYGEAWRKAIQHLWVGKGGRVVGDFPANYYTETDFSSYLTAALSKKPDIMLIGGPSSTTVLVVEQARSLGYKGSFILIDQVRADYIIKVLKDPKQMEGSIFVANTMDLPMPATPSFQRNYVAAYKRDITWECVLNYMTMHAIARAVKAADSTKAVDVRRKIYKALPMLGDQFPVEVYGINDNGTMYLPNVLQSMTNGKLSPVDCMLAFPKSRTEFNKYKSMSKMKHSQNIRWQPAQ